MLEGMPAGVAVSTADLVEQLQRRRGGCRRSARMTFEADAVEVLDGIRHGQTPGGPLAIRVGNTEWPKWERVMSPDAVDPAELAGVARNAPLQRR